MNLNNNNMSKEWIIKDAEFGKIKDIYIEGETIKEFINNVIYKHPNWSILLKNLSDIYVLVASLGSQNYLKNSEKSWKEIMNKEQYELLEKNRYFVIGYMLVDERYEKIHYIDFFDTVIRKNNLGYHMINEYKKQRNYEVELIPQKIIETSAKYWAKILDVLDEKFLVQFNLIDDFIESYNIKPEDISWDCLYNLCEEEEEEE
jgi:hypothetical protein